MPDVREATEKVSAVYKDHITDPNEQVGGILYQLSDGETHKKTVTVRMRCNQHFPGCQFINQRETFRRYGLAECQIVSSSAYSEIALCGQMDRAQEMVKAASDPQNLKPRNIVE